MTRYLGEEALVAYSNRFDTMQNEFLRAVDAFGLPFAPDADDAAARRDGRVAKLASRGIVLQNDAKSAYHKWISLACLACRTGERTESFITSMQCPHNCFFCFNPNQPNYEYYRTHVNPLVDDLQRRHDEDAIYDCLAVTGGEPLLHLDETLAFLKLARSLYPDAHLRLYTSGHGFDESIARRLVDAGLDEIRFSIKLEEGPELLDATYEALETAVGLIDSTMVEMPVFPDELEFMKELLVRLDELGVRGINLLELGFPFHNADEFARRGYLLKPHPYRVLYGYWYGGGLPIAGSEDVALDLLDFVASQKLSLGVHYCSLENRLTGQVYRQNSQAAACFPLRAFSQRDFFLKSAKVFGEAIDVVEKKLVELGLHDQCDKLYGDAGFLELPLAIAARIAHDLPPIAWGISFAIAEEDGNYFALKELRLDCVRSDEIPLD